MIRSIVTCVLCILSLWWQCVAWGDTVNDTSAMLQFDVSGQSADDGLREFAKQAGLAVIFRQQSVGAFKTNIVKGSFDINAGLARLLDSTGLEGRISKNGTIVIETTPSNRLVATKSSEGKQMNNKVLKKKLKKGTSSFLMSFLIATGLAAQDSNMQKARRNKWQMKGKI